MALIIGIVAAIIALISVCFLRIDATKLWDP